MLKLYDKSHTFCAWISRYSGRKIESSVNSGDKSMSFVLLEDVEIATEYYIRDGTDEYVVKEIDQETNEFSTVYCALNLEELEGKAWKTFSVTNVTIEAAARLAIAGTGWTVQSSNVSKQRNAGIIKKSALGVLEDLRTAFMCEIEFDTINKRISFYEERGSDRGVYFRSGLNMTKLAKKSTSYDYYTRIIPYGADDLDIKSVNGGVEYVENLQYSTKVRTYIWVDTNYTDATALKEDATAKLADMSKPEVSYQASIVDLASMSDTYDLLDYGLGDTIYLVDKDTGTKEKQRIVKMTEYPEEPENNTCELSNTFLTWEEMQAQLQAAAAVVDAVVSSDGQYNGKISVSDILHFSDGVVNDSQGTTLAQYIQTTAGMLGEISLEIGEITTNMLTADEAALTYATITNLDAATGRITTLEANSITSEYADLHYATIDSLTAATGRITVLEATSLTAATADLRYATITLSNVATENVKNLLVTNGIIKNATIVDGHIVGVLDAVTVNASDIVAGTLSVERLLIRGSTSGLVYALNNYGQLTSQQVNTIDGYVLTPRTITADRIVAGAITANEINTSDLYTNFLLTNFLAAAQAQVTSLSAINANIGTVTAGILRSSDYSYSSGTYTTSGMIINLNSKVIRMPNTAILADGSLYTRSGSIGGWAIDATTIKKTATVSGVTYTPILQAASIESASDLTKLAFAVEKVDGGVSTFPFIVRYNGSLTATDATITGTITATSGAIGGWDIDATTISKTATVSGVTYTPVLQAANISSSSDLTKVAFAVKKVQSGTTTYPFIVRYNGSITATDATIVGDITANTGTIGGWTIGATAISKSATLSGSTYTATMQSPNTVSASSGAFFISKQTGSTTTFPFVVHYDGSVTATNATIVGDITATSIDIKDTITLYTESSWGSTRKTTIKYVQTGGADLAVDYYNYNGGANLSPDRENTGWAYDEMSVPSGTFTYATKFSQGIDVVGRGYFSDTIECSGNIISNSNIETRFDYYGRNVYVNQIYCNGSIGSGGKAAYNDTANAGVWLSTTGTVDLSRSSTHGGIIGFHYNFSSSRTSSIEETASGKLTISNNLEVGGKISSGSVGTSGAVYTGGKTAYNDGVSGVAVMGGGFVDICHASAGGAVRFYYNQATSNTAKIEESASGEITITASNGFIVGSVYNKTTAGAANVIVASGGLLMRAASSSKRYKHDIRELKDYRNILEIPVVSFKYNDGYLGDGDLRTGKDIPGFIAEDVAKVYPIAAEWSEGKIEDWNARYVIPPMLAVLKDHDDRIADLERENKELKEEIKALKGGIAA